MRPPRLLVPIALRPGAAARIVPPIAVAMAGTRHLPSATRLSWPTTASPHLGLLPIH
jgi:hypothetical protein